MTALNAVCSIPLVAATIRLLSEASCCPRSLKDGCCIPYTPYKPFFEVVQWRRRLTGQEGVPLATAPPEARLRVMDGTGWKSASDLTYNMQGGTSWPTIVGVVPHISQRVPGIREWERVNKTRYRYFVDMRNRLIAMVFDILLTR